MEAVVGAIIDAMGTFMGPSMVDHGRGQGRVHERRHGLFTDASMITSMTGHGRVNGRSHGCVYGRILVACMDPTMIDHGRAHDGDLNTFPTAHGRAHARAHERSHGCDHGRVHGSCMRPVTHPMLWTSP